jgi:ribosomal protein S18 acetylase RimI-like enzyme
VRTAPLESSILERIQDYVRRYAAENRRVERTGPFLATFGLHSNGPYLNYAVPDDGSEPTDEEVARLVASYQSRQLRPRVEVLPRLAPAVVGTLLRAGFKEEGVLQFMACNAETCADVDPPSGIDIVFPSEQAQYMALVEVRHEAFGEPGSATTADAVRARASVEGGGFAAVAIEISSGEPVGSGACLIPYEGVTELTSVGVLSRCRRRGIGALVAATLTRAALMSGVEIVFLNPAHNEGERLYERVGFTKVGESLHLGL